MPSSKLAVLISGYPSGAWSDDEHGRKAMNLWAARAVATCRLDDLRRLAGRRAAVSTLTGQKRQPARLRYRIRHSIGRSLVEAGLHLLVGPSVR